MCSCKKSSMCVSSRHKLIDVTGVANVQVSCQKLSRRGRKGGWAKLLCLRHTPSERGKFDLSATPLLIAGPAGRFQEEPI